MIFADKIIRLRKRNGWSQEELAEKMNTSRQAVSKWEGAQSLPDINKIIQLGQLFGVTIDYLLKDEIEDEEYSEDDGEESIKHVGLANAVEYLEQRKKASVRIAIATLLCVLSPMTLILLGAASENPKYGINENIAGGVGLVTLLIIVAVAVLIFILCGFKNAPYEFLEKEPFINEYGVKGMVRERQKNFQKTYVSFNVIGTCLCIISPVFLFIGAFTENEFFTVIMLCITMAIAGIGAVFFILAGVPMASMQKLLKEGEYSVKEKKNSIMKEMVSTVYWLLVVALYLGISFITNDWETSWIVLVVGGVLYAAIMVLCNFLISKKDNIDG
ncbi:MAG: helix-turn-helix transcriptional regulator [Anaerovoracaceae bacterium]